MTTQNELLELIQNGENSGIEFKRDDLRPEQLARELVAFTNFMGGSVLLGVEDDGHISGIQRDDLETWVMNVCRDRIRPAIIPFFEVLRNVEGKDVAIIKVPRGATVHSHWLNNRNEYLIRVGSQVREASSDELGRLFQQRQMLRAEFSPVSGAGLDDLDRRRLKDYFERIRQQETPKDEDGEGWKTLLFNTELMSNEGVTMAGMLLFGLNPKRFLPQSGIEAVAYPGLEKDYNARERLAIRGAMTPLVGSFGIVETGLVEQALEFVRRNTPVETILADGARREERRLYPDEVLREAVVNALIHRDYLLAGTDIELSLYEDRLEIISPGRLPNGITPARMATGCRVSRNQLLKDVMKDYGYLEHMGMGIPRKIIKGMLAHNGTKPELREEDERFTIVLKASHVQHRQS
jgi:ATP-dependent DNA helicase RecG